MKTLTVFTPAYNRRHTIGRTYESLCRQTCKDFEWLIIDDGSTDKTKELCQSWIMEETILNCEGGFYGYSKDAQWLCIKYIYKENGGLHTGYNKAIELMQTEISVCIDSDDYMPDSAVENIIHTWGICHNKHLNVAGIVGLDYYDGKDEAIGGMFAIENEFIHLMEITPKYGHKGDTKIVCRVDLLKQYWPMPVFEGEKNFNPFFYYLQIDNFYMFYIVNKNFCYVDYQNNGMSANIFNQYKNSPNSFAALREEILSQHRLPFLLRLRNAIHFGSSIIFTGNYSRLFQNPSPLLKILAFPVSLILHLYIRIKVN